MMPFVKDLTTPCRSGLKNGAIRAIDGAMAPLRTGLENLIADPPDWLSRCRLGLLCNPASVDRRLRHARELLHGRFPGRLRTLFSPQHGFLSEKQDNMIESDHTVDPVLDLPVYSLYGQTRTPTDAMLDAIDALIVDLQDVGTRVYTFMSTLSYCMEAARDRGKKVVLLDRPNPISGSRIEGNCLEPDWASFVGRFPIPMRHGLTIGELARLFNDGFGIGCDLTVVPMSGWRRTMYFDDTGLPWVAPSPNLPTPASTVVYPGQVIWEGTNVSEGRGTTQPFELFGAPYLQTRRVLDALASEALPGVVLRETGFEPTWNKWKGQLCRGFQIHVVDRSAYAPVRTSLLLLQTIHSLSAAAFEWKSPPYEYAYRRQPIDLILGSRRLRKQLTAGEPIDAIVASWNGELARYTDMIGPFCLYD